MEPIANLGNIELLIREAGQGRLDGVKFYVEEENVDVNSTSRGGFSALHEASSKGNIEVVNYLVSRGANANIDSSCSRCLFDTPLFCAVSIGYVEVAKILIQSGARTDIVLNGHNLLDFAIKSDVREMISFVISLGFDINRRNDYGMTPLAYALQSEARGSVEFLLENGADYKKTSTECRILPYYYGRDGYGFWCLGKLLKHIEEKEGRKGVADYINCNDNSEGVTSLCTACYLNDDDAVELLLGYGADPNIRDKQGREPYEIFPHYGLRNKFQQDRWDKIQKLLESYERQHSRL